MHLLRFAHLKPRNSAGLVLYRPAKSYLILHQLTFPTFPLKGVRFPIPHSIHLHEGFPIKGCSKAERVASAASGLVDVFSERRRGGG